MRSCLFVLLVAAMGVIAQAQSVDTEFRQVADEWWEDSLRRNPLLATATGDHRFNDRLPTVSVAATKDRARQLKIFRQRLEQLDETKLTGQDAINFQIVRRVIANDLAENRLQMPLIPITNRAGFHISFPELRNQMPMETVEHVKDYLARLNAFPAYVEGHIELMRAGIAAGMTLPSVVLETYRDPIETHLVSDAKESLFYEPLQALSSRISADQKQQLQSEARQAIDNGIVPGYQAFLKFMAEEYVPAARGSLGASALPNGRELYRHRVKRFTTLDVTPEQVHELGKKEVSRIREEMRTVIRKVDFEGDVPEFTAKLRDDTRFHPKSAEQLMQATALILKRIDGELPQLFRTLPRTPYGLKPIPDYLAPQTTTAYYMPPPGDGSRAGYYFLNTYDLKSRPLYELEALSLHEAVPGHHLQLALQQELTDVPAYRRFADLTVFIEGWALYAERLGLEVGFYTDPYSDFGRLTYEMWRACRLVVDTGIHYFGWTRQQAIDFMAANTALSLHNIRAEVDRYIAWPGQALAYKIGELKIRELREQVEAREGEDFDIREFHEVVLKNGSLPLDVLEQTVHAAFGIN